MDSDALPAKKRKNTYENQTSPAARDDDDEVIKDANSSSSNSSEGKKKKKKRLTSSAESATTSVRRLNSASYHRGLTVLLDSNADQYFVTPDEFVGFKVMRNNGSSHPDNNNNNNKQLLPHPCFFFQVLVHNPRAYPEVEGNALAVGPGKETFISVTASHTDGWVKIRRSARRKQLNVCLSIFIFCFLCRSKAILDFPFEGRSCLFKEEKNFPQAEVKRPNL